MPKTGTSSQTRRYPFTSTEFAPIGSKFYGRNRILGIVILLNHDVQRKPTEHHASAEASGETKDTSRSRDVSL